MKRIPQPELFWSAKKITLTAVRHLDLILGSTVALPLPLWREPFLFTRAPDEALHDHTAGRFPVKLVPGKTHPVFALKPLAGGIGFHVCPCSSKTPWDRSRFPFIREGCRLKHSGVITDKNSYILNWLVFNIPRGMALTLRFKGEVPETCLAGDKEHLIE